MACLPDTASPTPAPRRAFAASSSTKDSMVPKTGGSDTKKKQDISENPRKKRIHLAASAEKNGSENDKLAADLSEMERLRHEDKVVEARKVVDGMVSTHGPALGCTDATSLAAKIRRSHPEHSELILEIVEESNFIHELFATMRSDEGWTLARDKHGVTVHYQKEPDSPIHTVRTTTFFERFTPLDFVRLCCLFAETELAPLWFPNDILKSNIRLAWPSPYEQVNHMKLAFPRFVPISPRDSVMHSRGYHLVDENALLITGKTVDSSPHCDVPPADEHAIRMESRMIFLVKVLGGGRVLFRMLSHDDLKFKYVPSVVLNYLAQGAMPFDFIRALKKALDNYDGSPWDEMMTKRKEFYGGIMAQIDREGLFDEGKEEPVESVAKFKGATFDNEGTGAGSGAGAGKSETVRPLRQIKLTPAVLLGCAVAFSLLLGMLRTGWNLYMREVHGVISTLIIGAAGIVALLLGIRIRSSLKEEKSLCGSGLEKPLVGLQETQITTSAADISRDPSTKTEKTSSDFPTKGDQPSSKGKTPVPQKKRVRPMKRIKGAAGKGLRALNPIRGRRAAKAA